MAVNYDKLWKLLIDKKMTRTELRKQIRTSTLTLAKMGKNEPVKMEVMIKICELFKCDIGDIMDIIPDKSVK